MFLYIKPPVLIFQYRFNLEGKGPFMWQRNLRVLCRDTYCYHLQKVRTFLARLHNLSTFKFSYANQCCVG